MLELYFFKPETIDRIRANWLGGPIERYVEWLDKEGYAARNVYRRVPILCHFGRFTQEQGVQSVKEAAKLVEDFAQDWLSRHGSSGLNEQAKAKVAEEARNPVNQMLKLALPAHAGGGRHSQPDPFQDELPGFFPHLVQERGLKEASIRHYRHYLRRFASFPEQGQVGSLKQLSAAILAAFVVDSAPKMARNTRRDLCGVPKAFLRYCHREGAVVQDLSQAVEMPQSYRLAELPRSISWDGVRLMLAAVDRRTVRGRRDYTPSSCCW